MVLTPIVIVTVLALAFGIFLIAKSPKNIITIVLVALVVAGFIYALIHPAMSAHMMQMVSPTHTPVPSHK